MSISAVWVSIEPPWCSCFSLQGFNSVRKSGTWLALRNKCFSNDCHSFIPQVNTNIYLYSKEDLGDVVTKSFLMEIVFLSYACLWLLYMESNSSGTLNSCLDVNQSTFKSFVIQETWLADSQFSLVLSNW